MNRAYRAGTATLVGKTNVGKSSLLNTVIGEKVAIVSDKPQTTRNRIAGILTTDKFQAVIYDTPGIHKPLHRLGEYLVRIAVAALSGVDLIVVVLDVSGKIGDQDLRVAEMVRRSKTPSILLLNKLDLCNDTRRAEAFVNSTRGLFENTEEAFFVSAKTGEGLEDLAEAIERFMPESPPLFPEDVVSDKPLRFMISEIVREKILELTRKEVPHSCGIYMQQFDYRDDGNIYILADIVVERDSQKPILIGRRGAMIKEIGIAARKDIEYLTDRKVFLELFVKVRKDWRQKDSMIQEFTGLKDEIK